MSLTFPQLSIFVLSFIAQTAVMVVMARRGLRSSFPLFFTYMGIYNLASVMVMGAYIYSYSQYFYIYWTLSTLLMVVGFMVLYEVFVALLKPFSAVIDLGKMLFVWAGVFLLLAAALTAIVTSGPRTVRLAVCVEMLDRCLHMMQCGMLMLLVLLEKRLNFSWRSPGMRIGLGLGVLAAIDLLVSYGQSQFPGKTLQFDFVNGVVFIGVVTFWTVYLRSSRAAANVASTPSRLILQRWNEALVGYGYGDTGATSSVESFLPGIEKTVDRVMARKAVS